VRVAQDAPGSSQFLFANLTSRFSCEGRSGRARQFSAFQFFNFSIFQFLFCDLRLSLCAVVAFVSRAFRIAFFAFSCEGRSGRAWQFSVFVCEFNFSHFRVRVAQDEPGSSQFLNFSISLLRFASRAFRIAFCAFSHFSVRVAQDEPGSSQF
jgi:hypothetical protein